MSTRTICLQSCSRVGWYEIKFPKDENIYYSLIKLQVPDGYSLNEVDINGRIITKNHDSTVNSITFSPPLPLYRIPWQQLRFSGKVNANTPNTNFLTENPKATFTLTLDTFEPTFYIMPTELGGGITFMKNGMDFYPLKNDKTQVFTAIS